MLKEYLIEFPTLTINEIEWKEKNNYNFINWDDIYIKMKKKLILNFSEIENLPEIDWLIPGVIFFLFLIFFKKIRKQQQ